MSAIPNIAEAQERERRIRNLLDRMASMTQEEADRMSASLRAQQAIEDASSGNTLPGSGNSDEASQTIRTALANREEIIRTNLTSTLGFVPSRNDLNELLGLQKTLGDSFSSTITSLSRVVGSVENGISSVLQAIDTGVSSAITSVISQAENLVNDTLKEIQGSIQGVIDGAQSDLENAIPEDVKNLVRDITSIPSAISDLTNSAVASINNVIGDINKELDSISNSIQNEAREFIDSNINKPIQDAINSTITKSISQAPTLPSPTNESGEQYQAGGGTLQPGDSTEPIVRQ